MPLAIKAAFQQDFKRLIENNFSANLLKKVSLPDTLHVTGLWDGQYP
jgi:hypothetical protein